MEERRMCPNLPLPLNEGKKTSLPKRIQPENGSPNDLVIQVNDSWRIRPAQGDWNIERLYSKKTAWTFEAHCRTLLDAVNTLLRRRMRQVEENDPTKIIAERESIRNEIMSAYRAFEQALERTAYEDTEREHAEFAPVRERRPISGGGEAAGAVVCVRARRGHRKQPEKRDFVQGVFLECMPN